MVNNCANCGKPTSNPRFCSKSCSATITNREVKRRKRIKKTCKGCGAYKFNDGKRFCVTCREHKISVKLNMTIRDVIDMVSVKYSHPSWKFATIRNWARSLYAKSDNKCQKCGYSRHTEVCHIKPLSSFPVDTLITVVNGIDNIIILCPNCHWEFDNL